MARLGKTRVLLLLTATALAATAAYAAAEPAELNFEGVAYYNAGKFSQALPLLEAAYGLAPDNGVIRQNLSRAYQAAAGVHAKQADFDSAVKLLEKALALDPDDVAPLLQLGQCYLRFDMLPEAILRLEQAVKVAEYNVQAHELLGEAYYRDNDLAAARTQWEWVLEQQPNREDLRTRLEKAGREETIETGFRAAASFHFQISSTPEVAGHLLQTVLAILEQAYADIGRNFGGVYPPEPVQVIVYNAQSFAEATQVRQNVGALYDGKIRIPLVDAAGLVSPEQELRETLYHEYTHVVVNFIAHNNAAWWMNEGLAETFSRTLDGKRLEMLQQAAADGRLIPYAGMEASMLKTLDSESLFIAYTQSHATLLYLWQRFGQLKLVQLLNALAVGAPTEQALLQTYNRNYDTLYAEVAQFIQNGCR